MTILRTIVLLALAVVLVVLLVAVRRAAVHSESARRRWQAWAELCVVSLGLSGVFFAIAGESAGAGLWFLVPAALVGLAARDVIRDYLLGMRVRAGYDLDIGDLVTVDGSDGRIATFGRFGLVLEDGRGRLIVPYSVVARSIVRRRSEEAGEAAHRFEVSWTSEHGHAALAPVIRRAVAASPHAALGRDVGIEPRGPRSVAVTVHALATVHTHDIEEAVRAALREAGVATA